MPAREARQIFRRTVLRLLSRFSILTKLTSVVVLIGVIVGGCLGYATSRMAAIDSAYAHFLNHDTKAIADLRTVNRLIFTLSYFNVRNIVETTPAGMQRTDKGFEEASERLNKTIPVEVMVPFVSTASEVAWVRERIGRAEEDVNPPAEVATVADLMAWLAGRGENYAYAFENPGVIRSALDHTHAPHGTSLQGVREIAFFPPMTGG